jgi:hypothetical protein
VFAAQQAALDAFYAAGGPPAALDDEHPGPLTAEQQRLWDTYVARRRETMEAVRSGATSRGGAPAAPPGGNALDAEVNAAVAETSAAIDALQAAGGTPWRATNAPPLTPEQQPHWDRLEAARTRLQAAHAARRAANPAAPAPTAEEAARAQRLTAQIGAPSA